jgi:hypothetical protein
MKEEESFRIFLLLEMNEMTVSLLFYFNREKCSFVDRKMAMRNVQVAFDVQVQGVWKSMCCFKQHIFLVDGNNS